MYLAEVKDKFVGAHFIAFLKTNTHRDSVERRSNDHYSDLAVIWEVLNNQESTNEANKKYKNTLVLALKINYFRVA